MIIGLDTSTPLCRLSIFTRDTWHEYDWQADRRLAHELLGKLEAAIRDSGGQGLESTHGIVVYAGPGSYTGLRIGLTVVNTLAEGVGVPIVGETGEDWRNIGLARLHRGEDDKIVMPIYGGAPHITTPRK